MALLLAAAQPSVAVACIENGSAATMRHFRPLEAFKILIFGCKPIRNSGSFVYNNLVSEKALDAPLCKRFPGESTSV